MLQIFLMSILDKFYTLTYFPSSCNPILRKSRSKVHFKVFITALQCRPHIRLPLIIFFIWPSYLRNYLKMTICMLGLCTCTFVSICSWKFYFELTAVRTIAQSSQKWLSMFLLWLCNAYSPALDNFCSFWPSYLFMKVFILNWLLCALLRNSHSCNGVVGLQMDWHFREEMLHPCKQTGIMISSFFNISFLAMALLASTTSTPVCKWQFSRSGISQRDAALWHYDILARKLA